MSSVNQANTGQAYGFGRYLLSIFCGAALLTDANFHSVGAQSDTAKAGQMQAQLATGITYHNQNAPASTKSVEIFPANNGSARYICTPSGSGQNSLCVLRN